MIKLSFTNFEWFPKQKCSSVPPYRRTRLWSKMPRGTKESWWRKANIEVWKPSSIKRTRRYQQEGAWVRNSQQSHFLLLPQSNHQQNTKSIAWVLNLWQMAKNSPRTRKASSQEELLYINLESLYRNSIDSWRTWEEWLNLYQLHNM